MHLFTDDELSEIYVEALRDHAENHPREWTFPTHIPGRATEQAVLARVVERLRELEANEQAVAFRLVGESRVIARSRMDAFRCAASEFEPESEGK